MPKGLMLTDLAIAGLLLIVAKVIRVHAIATTHVHSICCIGRFIWSRVWPCHARSITVDRHVYR